MARAIPTTRSPATLAAAVTSTGLIAFQVAGKAGRDALFLTRFPAAALPLAMAAAAALSLVAAIGLSRWMTHRSAGKVLPIVCGASALGLVLEWYLGLDLPRASAALVYLHTTALGPVMISIFWSLINERFDPHAARRAIAQIAAGGTIGGVLGALLAWRASSLIELPTLLLLLAGMHAACALCAVLIRAPAVPGASPIRVVPTDLADMPQIRTSPLLRNLGVLVALGAAMTALLDYLFNAGAVATFGTGPPLLEFFGLFWLGVSVLSLLVQVTVGKTAMEKLGLATNVGVFPGIVLLGSAISLAVPGLVGVAVLRGAAATHHNTLFRTAYELLYAPLDAARKRAAKALIDVGFDRFGTVVGSAIAFIAVTVAAASPSPVIFAFVLVLAGATLLVARRLHYAYVGALEQGMRDGAKGLNLPAIEGHPSQSALETTESVQRELLIGRVEVIRPGGLGERHRAEAPAPGPASEALRYSEALIEQARDLLSGDSARTRRALSGWPGNGRPLADFAILLLTHDELHVEASQALRRVAPSITGELIDALLDPSMDFIVRRRIPGILVAAASQRAADGLLAGIHDERFEVRYACGRALMKLRHDHAAVVIPHDQVVAAILKEREKSSRPAPDGDIEIDASDEGDQRSSLVDVLLRDRVDRSLEHVFTLLSLCFQREPLRIAFRALHHPDLRHRGTALEYLNTILPPEFRHAVWPLLGETGPLPQTRSAREILADLAGAMRSPYPFLDAPPPAAAGQLSTTARRTRLGSLRAAWPPGFAHPHRRAHRASAASARPSRWRRTPA